MVPNFYADVCISKSSILTNSQFFVFRTIALVILQLQQFYHIKSFNFTSIRLEIIRSRWTAADSPKGLKNAKSLSSVVWLFFRFWYDHQRLVLLNSIKMNSGAITNNWTGVIVDERWLTNREIWRFWANLVILAILWLRNYEK